MQQRAGGPQGYASAQAFQEAYEQQSIIQGVVALRTDVGLQSGHPGCVFVLGALSRGGGRGVQQRARLLRKHLSSADCARSIMRKW